MGRSRRADSRGAPTAPPGPEAEPPQRPSACRPARGRSPRAAARFRQVPGRCGAGALAVGPAPAVFFRGEIREPSPCPPRCPPCRTRRSSSTSPGRWPSWPSPAAASAGPSTPGCGAPQRRHPPRRRSRPGRSRPRRRLTPAPASGSPRRSRSGCSAGAPARARASGAAGARRPGDSAGRRHSPRPRAAGRHG
jgi:hypothetical protein